MTNTIPPNPITLRIKHSKPSFLEELEKKYKENLKANQGWMANIDKMDGNPDGWVKVETLYQQFPGLKKEISGVNTKYENGTIFYNASQMAEFITKAYNNK